MIWTETAPVELNSGDTATMNSNGRTLMNGHDPTFEELYATYQHDIYRYAMRLTQNQADADDLFQESMLKAFKAFERLTDTSELRAWLYKITTNAFLSNKRKLKREQVLDDATNETLVAREHDAAAAIDARDTLAEVKQFVASLPEKQRAALMLRKYQEFDYADIAGILDCSEDAARANVYAALKKLRTQFGDRV